MSGPFSFGFRHGPALAKGVRAPVGYILLVDDDGAFLVDDDGAYLIERI